MSCDKDWTTDRPFNLQEFYLYVRCIVVEAGHHTLETGSTKSARSDTKVSPTFAVLALRPWYERSSLSVATGMPLAAN